MRAAGDERYFLFLHTYAAHYPYGGLERYRREHPERGLPSDAEVAELTARARARGSLALTPERMLELDGLLAARKAAGPLLWSPETFGGQGLDLGGQTAPGAWA